MNKNSEIAIKVDAVYKNFNLPHEVHDNLKQKILHPFKRRTTEHQHALKDISFEINRGDFFGIVGRNGSGKSTLLKIIAGIYTPTKGSVTINGSLTPFIELGVGFNPELTGRENVFLNGAMLGFSKKEMLTMYDEIVEFAELEKFMDQKLKNYSSGMQVRLAFSVAIRAKSDILLLDEVLAVGDTVFQQKCFKYFSELKKNKQTVVFVSHDMTSVKKYCNKAILIKDSHLTKSGSPIDIGDQYMVDAGQAIAGQEERAAKKLGVNGRSALQKGYGSIEIAKAVLVESPKPNKEYFEISLEIKSEQDISILPAISILKSPDMISVAEMNYGKTIEMKKGEIRAVTFRADTSYLNGGEYFIHHAILDNGYRLVMPGSKVLTFNIRNRDKKYGGILKINGSWS